MKNTTALFSLLLLGILSYLAFYSLMPTYEKDRDPEPESFSTDRAMEVVKNVSQRPHAVGFPAHENVRDYIVNELSSLGLASEIQHGKSMGDFGNYSRVQNILARIRGTGEGRALLLLSHYDSSPHSSLGASDAGSGVATILEGIRAYLSTSKTPLNDIIILITDAEEIGLNGAELFVKHHPWAKDVDLALNFEARGSGGPSYMLIETNQGNKKLIEEFSKAGVDYPVANSLAYSIYKMLPNDTDLTVFREDGDIDGFNFAFIDDHFDYHTVLDNQQRLNPNSLAHQGEYLMPLLHYFSNTDLSKLKSNDDLVYFNVPLFHLVSYPFSWIWPMFILALIAFIILVVHGIKIGVLQGVTMLKGGLAVFLVLVLNGLLGYFSWPLIKNMYPAYTDMLHGFPYNGHAYIAALVLLAMGSCFMVFGVFRKYGIANMLVVPIAIWLVICALLNVYLPGASFLLIPVYALIAAFMVTINQEKPKSLLLVALSVPAIWMLTPFLQMFPVGLGLKMLVVVTILATLIFLMLFPLIGRYRFNKKLGLVFILGGIYFFIQAHLQSGFDEKNPKPSSLVYVLDTESGNAQWATYDKVLTEWNAPYFSKAKITDSESTQLVSKYMTGYSHVAPAPLLEISGPDIVVANDTVINGLRTVTLNISHKRLVNRLGIFTDFREFSSIILNGENASQKFLQRKKDRGTMLTHYITNNDATELQMEFTADNEFVLTFYESSHTLLSTPKLGVTKRPVSEIPMPFVLNDAIIVKSSLAIRP